ncbi:putative methyltransferase domain protein [Mycobacterium xenopi 3993]|nr:putative methyltransferase domain protein [Mycobacterium xenopi 3993]
MISDVNALDFPGDAFDVVRAHQVLQHVADPIRTRCRRRLLSWAQRAASTTSRPLAPCGASRRPRPASGGRNVADRVFRSALAHQLVDSGPATPNLDEISSAWGNGPLPLTVGWRFRYAEILCRT